MKSLLLALLVATEVHATVVMRNGPPRFTSASGRFSVVLDESRPKLTATLFDQQVALTTVELAWPSTILVDDAGRFFVAVQLRDRYDAQDLLLTIYGRDGALHVVRAGDVFSPSDLGALNWQLRPEATLDGPRIHLTIGSEVLRIDALTGQNLDAGKRDFLPLWRVWSVPDAAFPGARRTAALTCTTEVDPTAALRITPRELHERATARPLPEYPNVARKARVAGSVWVEVVVSESGEVVCTRPTQLAFGLDSAALEAVQRWRFEPYLVRGRAVPVTSDVEIVFGYAKPDPQP